MSWSTKIGEGGKIPAKNRTKPYPRVWYCHRVLWGNKPNKGLQCFWLKGMKCFKLYIVSRSHVSKDGSLCQLMWAGQESRWPLSVLPLSHSCSHGYVNRDITIQQWGGRKDLEGEKEARESEGMKRTELEVTLNYKRGHGYCSIFLIFFPHSVPLVFSHSLSPPPPEGSKALQMNLDLAKS